MNDISAMLNRIRIIAQNRLSSNGAVECIYGHYKAVLLNRTASVYNIEYDENFHVCHAPHYVKLLPAHKISKNYNYQIIGDRLILLALDYVGENYIKINDYIKNGRVFRSTYFDTEKSFAAFANLTDKDTKAGEYRRAFCRILTWIQEDQFCEIHADGELFPKTQLSKVESTIAKEHLEKIFYAYENGKSAGFPFMKGNINNRRKLCEAFCRTLMEFGELDDAVKIASEYPDIVPPAALIKHIEVALSSRKLEQAKVLLDILVTYEKSHPDADRLLGEVSRITKIVQLQSSADFDFSAIDQMSGADFEQLIASKFSSLGFAVESTPVTGDYGADLIVTTPNASRISIQCKRFKSKVNLKAVQEVVASLSHYQCDYGIVITNSSFLNSAKKLAENNDIELWDQNQLIDFLSGNLSFSQLCDL